MTEPEEARGDNTEARRQRILLRAEALSSLPEYTRCPNVTLLICEAATFGICADDEIFQAAYGDPSGRTFWDACLSEPMPVNSLAQLQSAYQVESGMHLADAEVVILRAFRDAAQAGETWFVGETAALLSIGEGYGPFVGLAEVRARPRAAVEWLLAKPKREHLVPDSLRRHLRPAGSSAPVSVGSGASVPVGSSARLKERVHGGPKPKADWEVVEIALQSRIDEIGRPTPDHDDKNWQSRADVVRWVSRLLIKRGERVAASTIGERVDKMFPNLVQRQTELDGDQSPPSGSV